MVSKFYEKICAILPNNLLSKIKESNEKLTDTYNKMTNYYNNIRIIKRTSSSDKEGGKKMILQINKVDDIPATLIQNDNAFGPTLIQNDEEEEYKIDDKSINLKIKLKLRGKNDVIQAFEQNKLNTLEELKINMTQTDE